MNKLLVGISIGFSEETIKQPFTVYANGIRQHFFILYDTLKNIDIIEDVYFVNCGNASYKDQKFSSEITSDYKFVDLTEIENDIDLVIEMGMEINHNKILELKSKGVKVVGYGAGNTYVIHSEKFLFNDNKGDMANRNYLFDEFWTNEQHVNTCKPLWEAIYKTKVKVLPHVWSPKFIDNEGLDLTFKGIKDKARVTIFEPNMNVVKTFVYPLLICEKLYESNPELLKHIYVTNSYKLKDKPTFRGITKSLKVTQNGIATYEGRFKTSNMLANYTDVVVTHQWENALNYLYYELLYFGYPMIHNSHLMKNVGYYYEGFNVDEGALKLKEAINNHNIETYNKKSNEYLWTINPKNTDVIDIHKKHIENLFLPKRSRL